MPKKSKSQNSKSGKPMNIEIIPPGFAYGYGYHKTDMQEIAESNRLDVQGLPDGWDKQGIKKKTNRNAGRRESMKKL